MPIIRRGLPLVILQPGVIYGPGDHSAVHDAWAGLLTGRLAMVPEGTAYCWAHVEDVAEAHVLAMETARAGESYIVAGPRHSSRRRSEMAARIAGVPPPRRRVSPRVLKAVAALLRPVDRVVPLAGQFSPEYLSAIAGTTYIGDNAKARRELGYAPRPLEVGLVGTMAWEQAELARRRGESAGRELAPRAESGRPGTLAPTRCPSDPRGGQGLPINTPRTDHRRGCRSTTPAQRQPAAQGSLRSRSGSVWRAASTARRASPRPARAASCGGSRALAAAAVSRAERARAEPSLPQRAIASRAQSPRCPSWCIRSVGVVGRHTRPAAPASGYRA